MPSDAMWNARFGIRLTLRKIANVLNVTLSKVKSDSKRDKFDRLDFASIYSYMKEVESGTQEKCEEDGQGL